MAGLMVRRMYPRLLARGGQIPPGGRKVLVEQLSHGDAGVGLPSGPRKRKQLTQLYLGVEFALAGLPEPDLAAVQ
jgi:hypothetical protein